MGSLLGHAELALNCGASSRTTVLCQGGILKDAAVGFASVQTVCYLLWVDLCRAWT